MDESTNKEWDQVCEREAAKLESRKIPHEWQAVIRREVERMVAEKLGLPESTVEQDIRQWIESGKWSYEGGTIFDAKILFENGSLHIEPLGVDISLRVRWRNPNSFGVTENAELMVRPYTH